LRDHQALKVFRREGRAFVGNFSHTEQKLVDFGVDGERANERLSIAEASIVTA
jgi:hypothetical protein